VGQFAAGAGSESQTKEPRKYPEKLRYIIFLAWKASKDRKAIISHPFAKAEDKRPGKERGHPFYRMAAPGGVV
jgi:hypothetical protein